MNSLQTGHLADLISPYCLLGGIDGVWYRNPHNVTLCRDISVMSASSLTLRSRWAIKTRGAVLLGPGLRAFTVR